MFHLGHSYSVQSIVTGTTDWFRVICASIGQIRFIEDIKFGFPESFFAILNDFSDIFYCELFTYSTYTVFLSLVF